MLDCEFTVVEGPYRPAQVLAELHRRGRQARREGPVEGLEHLQERLPRDGRQRARSRPQGREPGRQAEARDSGTEAARRHRVRRAHHGRAGLEPAVQGRRTSSPTSCCRAIRNTPRSCAARTCSPTPSTPSRARPRPPSRAGLGNAGAATPRPRRAMGPQSDREPGGRLAASAGPRNSACRRSERRDQPGSTARAGWSSA